MIVPLVLNKDISYRSSSILQNSTQPSAFDKFQKDNFVKQNLSVDMPKQVVNVQPVVDNVASQKAVDNKKLIMGVALIATVATTIGAVLIGKKNINKPSIVEDIKTSFSKINDLFPQDAQYRNRISRAIGLSSDEGHRLYSIVGTEELTKVAKEFEQNPEVYSPGTPNYSIWGSVLNFNNENVFNRKFGANLHLHTDNSDGVFNVQDLLNKVVEYADKRFETLKKPFYLAITDHDSVNGCKEAVEIVSQNPEKYKNLRLILGIENTFVYKNPNFVDNEAHIHVLSYGINPYSSQFEGLFGNNVKKNISNIKKSISEANKQFQPILSKNGVDYSFEDMTKLSKAIGVGVKNATFYMKDYLQFKYIFTKQVLNNSDLCSELIIKGINLSDINYAQPTKLMPLNLDYSKGQKHFDYYYEAVKEYVSNLVDGSSKTRIENLFAPIGLEDRLYLAKIEDETLNINSPLYVKACEYLGFEEGLSKLADLSDGVIGMAHPGVMFPIGALKYKSRITDMYDDLYSIFKKKGGDKAIFVEDNYQSYYKSNIEEFVGRLQDVSKKYGLIKTGGLDTHGNDIFSV